MTERFHRVPTKIPVFLVAIVGTVLVVTLGACAGADTVAPAADTRLAAACDSLTVEFMTTLKGELTAALQEGGPAYAVKVCKVTSLEIAAQSSRTPGWTIKRVSARNRNPENAPDDYEANALARLAAVDGPPVFYEWQKRSNAESTFVYFKAIRTAELCLSCHGPRETLSSDLLAVLAQEYPDDLATGYAPGDLRGAFVVRVDASAIQEAPRGGADLITP